MQNIKELYNGETADDIFKRKKLRYREDILDNMGIEELADNIFRTAQTAAKLKRDNVDNEYIIKYCSDDRIIARKYELV